jgi:PAS domain-containing protein
MQNIYGYWHQGKVTYNESGKPIKIYGTSMDITDRKNAEEKLRQSEERFRAVQAKKDGQKIIVETSLQVILGVNDQKISLKPTVISPKERSWRRN